MSDKKDEQQKYIPEVVELKMTTMDYGVVLDSLTERIKNMLKDKNDFGPMVNACITWDKLTKTKEPE